MSSSAARRSTRPRKVVKYTLAPADDDAESSTAAAVQDAHGSDASEYEDAENGLADEEEEDVDFDDGDMPSENDDGHAEPGPVQSSALPKGVKRKHPASRQKTSDAKGPDKSTLHSRGLGKENALYSRSSQIKTSYGPCDDWMPVIVMRDLWTDPMDSTFPSKKTLTKVLRGRPSNDPMSVHASKLDKEATEGWDWYYREMGQAFTERQLLFPITDSQGQKYMPDIQSSPMGVLIGPVDSQQFHELPVGGSMDFGTAFEKRTREGWILNLGNKVQCLSWCPNVCGRFQYLAVAAPVLDHQKYTKNEDTTQRHSNPFTPSPPYPAAIQIWAFAVLKGNKKGLDRLNMKVAPRLVKVICTEAGDVRRLAWCPSPRTWRDCDNTMENIKNIGLLGGVYSDGTVRVYDVRVKQDFEKTHATEYVMAQSPAFQAQFSNTLCTCFSWLSPSDIVIGHSDGSIAVWSLVTEKKLHRPLLHTPLHTTYIVNIETAYPQRPDLIVTMAMDGQVRLVSLLDVKSDVVDSSRSRLISPCLAYSPILMSFMTADEVDILRLFPIRRFTSPLSVARTYSALSAIAPGSMYHPIALLANVGGAVIATNPLSRTLHAKAKHWQQLWFSHTWAAKPTDDSENHPGTVKFIDGFRAEVPSLLRHATGDGKTSSGTTNVTIFEEKTAVTTLAWNSNRQCSGWAAAGMGSGLLRVEDLSI